MMRARKDQRCENCDAWKADRGNQGICRAHPGLPVVLGMQQVPAPVMAMVNRGQPNVQPVIQCLQSMMAKDQWCREWMPIIETTTGLQDYLTKKSEL